MIHLKQEYFNKLWKALSALYQTQAVIKNFIDRAKFDPAKVALLGTGEDMVYSFLGLVEKDGKVLEVITLALSEYPGNPALDEMLVSVKDHSAYLEEVAIPTPATTTDVRVILIYDSEDKKEAKDLFSHLYPLQKFSQLISIFDTHKHVAAGSDWKEKVEKELDQAQIVLLLMTIDFMSNDDNHCTDLALRAFKMKKHVVPVLMKPCQWDRISNLENIVSLPRNKPPVSEWPNKDQALLEISNEIENLAKSIKKGN